VRVLLTVPEALRAVLGRAHPLDAEETALATAVGRVLASPATSLNDLPPFASSAMDGFALQADDTPGELTVTARIAAGSPVHDEVRPGEAMAISTGGEVPAGADAVVPIEQVRDSGSTVLIHQLVARGDNIRPRGGDVAAGVTVVPAGVVLGPAQLGAIAAAGLPTVRCTRRPRVAVVITGNELRQPGEPLGPGEIYEANGPILDAQIRSAGAELEGLSRVPDDGDLLRAALASALDVDVVVTTGGASVGEHDLVRRIATELGVEELFWGVAVRPGRPIAFGTRGATLVFGLPGNPVSSLVGLELFFRPALLALQGPGEPGPRFRPGRLTVAAHRNGERDALLRARAVFDADDVMLTPLGGQESHMIARAAGAQALVLVPRGEGELVAGSAVRYLAI
jgi:molybdopterin molybdotransferase